MYTSVSVFHWKFQLNQIKKNRLMAVSIQRDSGDIPESTYEHFSEVPWTSMNFLSIHNLVFWDSQKFTMNTSVNFLSIHNLVFWDSPRFTYEHFSERFSLKISAQLDWKEQTHGSFNTKRFWRYTKVNLWILQWSSMNLNELFVYP